jgi:trans-aconitate 2-methyltransferase
MWRGAQYDRVADPQHRWGLSVLDRLPENGVTRILDAGCGSGRVTEQVCEQFRKAEVVAIDSSASMLDAARERLVGQSSRVTLAQVDLEDSTALRALGTFNAVISTGTLHWVLDHGRLFSDLRQMMSNGGVFASQSGGEGSVEAVRTILVDLGIEWQSMNNYANADETCEHLVAAGFSGVECWMADESVVFDNHDSLRAYLLDGVIAPYVSSLAEPARKEVAAEVANRLPVAELRFVRLNIRAEAEPC